MSDEVTKKLELENKMLNDNQKGLLAQMEARSQLLNENLASNLQLRAQIVLFQQGNQENAKEIANLKKQLADLTNERDSLLNKITELDATIANFSQAHAA